jgi:hypothetical protein
VIVVIDLGCHTHAGHPADESVQALIGRYHPDVLYGYDPHPDLEPGETTIDGTRVVLERSAAWTYNGFIAYDRRPDRVLAAAIGYGDEVVPCFDLAERVEDGAIVKMDVEGAEYGLLEHLRDTGADEKIRLLLVEWHPPWDLTGTLVRRLRCPVEPWA